MKIETLNSIRQLEEEFKNGDNDDSIVWLNRIKRNLILKELLEFVHSLNEAFPSLSGNADELVSVKTTEDEWGSVVKVSLPTDSEFSIRPSDTLDYQHSALKQIKTEIRNIVSELVKIIGINQSLLNTNNKRFLDFLLYNKLTKEFFNKDTNFTSTKSIFGKEIFKVELPFKTLSYTINLYRDLRLEEFYKNVYFDIKNYIKGQVNRENQQKQRELLVSLRSKFKEVNFIFKNKLRGIDVYEVTKQGILIDLNRFNIEDRNLIKKLKWDIKYQKRALANTVKEAKAESLNHYKHIVVSDKYMFKKIRTLQFDKHTYDIFIYKSGSLKKKFIVLKDNNKLSYMDKIKFFWMAKKLGVI